MAAEADADVEDVVVAEDGLLMRLMSVLTLVGRIRGKVEDVQHKALVMAPTSAQGAK